MSDRTVLRWIVDVGPLWTNHASSTSSRTRALTKDWNTIESVQSTLQHLSPDEQAKVLRFHFAIDAKLALASCLLKRRAISEICHVPWTKAIVREDSNRKPCYMPENGTEKTLEFNVSHHGTLVPIVACEGKATRLGVDVVSIDTERQYASITKSGFESWAKTYEAVFSDREVQDIIDFEPPGEFDDRSRLEAKIRHFYAHWCFKEAYVKMTATGSVVEGSRVPSCAYSVIREAT